MVVGGYAAAFDIVLVRFEVVGRYWRSRGLGWYELVSIQRFGAASVILATVLKPDLGSGQY